MLLLNIIIWRYQKKVLILPPSIIIGSMLNKKLNKMVAKFLTKVGTVQSESGFYYMVSRCTVFNCRKNKYGFFYESFRYDDDKGLLDVTIGIEKFVTPESRDTEMFKFMYKLLSHLTLPQIQLQYPNLWKELQKRNLLKR